MRKLRSKKFFILLLAIFLIIGISGCDLNDDPVEDVVEEDYIPVGSVEEFVTALEEGEEDLIVLENDIVLDEEKVAPDINRDIIIDGDDNYGFTGTGTLQLTGNGEERYEELEQELTFQNISFEPEGAYEWEVNGGVHRDFIHIVSNEDVNFADVEVEVKGDSPFIDDLLDNFLIIYLGADNVFTVEGSSFELADAYGFDLNNGGQAVFRNNVFKGQPIWTVLRILNSSPTDITIAGNDFTEVETQTTGAVRGSILDVHTEFYPDGEDVIINDIVLEPVLEEDEEKEEKFKDAARKAHESIEEKNNVSEDYFTTYNYGDLDKDFVERIMFVGMDDPDIEYKGQVVIENEEPEKPIELRVFEWEGGYRGTFTTEADGSFVLPSRMYTEGDNILILVGGDANFENPEEKNINNWTNLNWFEIEEGEQTLPDIDIYNYGLELIEPAENEEILLPYEVVINEYDRPVDNLEYSLFFYDLDYEEYLGGSKETYSSGTFEFDGTLGDSSVLNQDAIWAVNLVFTEEISGQEWQFSIGTFGQEVYLDR